MMATPAFDATRFVRPALLSIALYFSVIVIAWMSTIGPVSAATTVASAPATTQPVLHLDTSITYVISDSGNSTGHCGTGSGLSFTAACNAQACVGGWVQQGNNGGPLYYGVNSIVDYTCTYYAGGYTNQKMYGATITQCPSGYTYGYTYARGWGYYTCTLTDPAACPANMSGTPCACNLGFVPDSNGACVEEILTITLSGGTTTEPWNEIHDPDHTAANLPFLAIVKNQIGQPKAGVNVNISLDVTPGTGGHTHNDGRPKGKLVATQGNPVSAVSTVNGGETLSGATDSGGIFWFIFGAEEASGEHKLSATCASCAAPANATVEVAIQSLMRLGYDQACTTTYCLQGGKPWHPDNHYFTGAAMSQVVLMAGAYVKEYGELLLINDSSLKEGGLCDIHQDWSPSHRGHRKGIVVDINNFSVRDEDFEQFVSDHQAIAKWEEDPPHYHLRLLKRDE